MLFALHFDLKTTRASFSAFDPDNRKVFPVSSVIIFAFLNLNTIIIQRTFANSLEKLANDWDN